MTYASIKENMELHPEYDKTYKGRVIKKINGTIGNSPFDEGVGVFVVVARKSENDDWRVYVTSQNGRKDWSGTMKESPKYIKLETACTKDPYKVIDDNFSSHNSRVF